MAQIERLGKARVKGLTIKGTPVTATGAAINNLVQGVAAGDKFAHGVASITGTGTVTHGLATIVAVLVALEDDPSTAATLATATWTGTTLTIKVWKPTATGDVTPIAATAAKNVSWLAIGT